MWLLAQTEQAQWLQVLIQGGALGVLILGIILLYRIATALFDKVPTLVKDSLKEINDANRGERDKQYENAKSERKDAMDGFSVRSRMLVDELSEIRKTYPLIAGKIDELIRTVEEQTDILRKWPSDPNKVCMAQQMLGRIETLVALMEKKTRNNH